MAVQRMQEYMMANHGREITLEQLATAAKYSPWHALRAFSQLTGKTPFDYLRSLRLTQAAKKLRDTNQSVLDIALEAAFGSHEGFTKAFSREFAISPRKYRQTAPPIPFFSYYPVYHQNFIPERRNENMGTSIVFTQVIERPQRQLILKRGLNAKDYFAYCEEVGCDVWGLLESVKETLYEPIGLWLPEEMRKPATSEYCQGVEVAPGFTGALPAGFDLIDLPACKYMIFHGEPFNDEDFCDAIGIVWDAIKRYDPKYYGWEFYPQGGPRFQLEPVGKRGYIEGLPVQEYRA